MGIEQKVEQMYTALADIQITQNLQALKPAVERSGNRFTIGYDFTKAVDSATAANRVGQLLANIACLKDHLKAWCKKNGELFRGEELINTNKEVAIVHDLWNLDKHAELDRSRSGFWPRLREPAIVALTLKGGPEAAVVTLSFGGGIQSKGDVALRIVATIVDKDGNSLGQLEDICEKAVAAWEAEFKRVGITL